jgi:hypothetical protein
MTNRIDWKEMTIAAVGLLALVFNPASESGKAILAKFFTPVQGLVEQASARSQEAFAVAQMQAEMSRATLVENQTCARTARAQAAVEARQARIAAREVCAQLRLHRAELRQARDMRLVIVKSSDATRLSF